MRIARFLPLVVGIGAPVVALTVGLIGAFSGTLELYGNFGWRVFESVAVFVASLIFSFSVYRIKQQSAAIKPSGRSSRSSNKAQREYVRKIEKLRVEHDVRKIRSLAIFCSILLIIPSIDLYNQTSGAISSYFKAKATEADKTNILPLASKFNVDGETIENKDFSRQDLTLARAASAIFADVSFSGATLEEADFRNSTFKSNVEMTGVRLCGADFRGADLTGMKNLEHAKDLRFVFFDSRTIFPKDDPPDFLNGVVKDTSAMGFVYQCRDGESRVLRNDGTRK